METRLTRVREKVQAANAIALYCRETNLSPDDINGYLESVGTPAIKQRTKIHSILMRPQIDMEGLRKALPNLNDFLKKYDAECIETAEIDLKYEAYIQKEQDMAAKMRRLEDLRLHDSLDYHLMPSLSIEARQKLTKIRPRTIGQASRISGVSPSDISVLLIHVGR
jgi:tRNA uridine 5-carboxymethylaminomethyl modification enzyme